jgi:hypothetical protein
MAVVVGSIVDTCYLAVLPNIKYLNHLRLFLLQVKHHQKLLLTQLVVHLSHNNNFLQRIITARLAYLLAEVGQVEGAVGPLQEGHLHKLHPAQLQLVLLEGLLEVVALGEHPVDLVDVEEGTGAALVDHIELLGCEVGVLDFVLELHRLVLVVRTN